MDKKIIHIVLGKANPARMNGVNKVVNSLATAQSSLGADVAVWGITRNKEKNYPLRNYETILFQDYAFKFKLDSKLLNALKKVDKNTIFHIHGGFIPQFFMVAKSLVENGLEYIYTTHGAYNTVALQRSKLKKKLYILLFEKYIVSHAKSLHFIGASEITGAKKLFGEIPCVLIPNGQEPLDKSVKIDRFRKSSDEYMVIGFCGRIDIHTKGLDILLKGLALIERKTRNKIDLWIIGDGNEMPKLRRLASTHGLMDNITFWGAKFGNEKLNIMANMDFFILNSRNEGMPGVVLEAASQKTPAIVSKQTNIDAYITKYDAGLVIDENCPEGIKATLLKALEVKLSKHHRTLKENASKMVEDAFSWKLIAEKTLQLYTSETVNSKRHSIRTTKTVTLKAS